MLHPESFPINASWYTKLTNKFPLMIDDRLVTSLGVAWLFKYQNEWCPLPRFIGKEWQYANAIFYVKVTFPFGIWLHVRWSDNPDVKRQFYQCGIGWKDSGRFAVHSRLQSDKTAADGYHTGLPNLDQTTGFNFGRH